MPSMTAILTGSHVIIKDLSFVCYSLLLWNLFYKVITSLLFYWSYNMGPLFMLYVLGRNSLAEPIPLPSNNSSEFQVFLLDLLPYLGGNPHGVVVNMLDCDTVVSEFEFQSRYNIHFQTNALSKGMNSHIPFSNRLNSTTTVLFQGWL